jgi:hypothetical protein
LGFCNAGLTVGFEEDVVNDVCEDVVEDGVCLCWSKGKNFGSEVMQSLKLNACKPFGEKGFGGLTY